jgi:hypothetical protein
MYSPAPEEAGVPINRPVLQARGQRPARRARGARPLGRVGARAMAFGATAGPGPIRRGVPEASASAM